MNDDEPGFSRRVVQATVQQAAKRNLKGIRYWLRRFFPGASIVVETRDMGRFSERAVVSALSEAADRFTPLERRRFDLHGELPEWFWPWVDERSEWWQDID